MSAYDLRKHLAIEHGITLRGLVFRDLVTVHEVDHARGTSHQWGLTPARGIDDVDTRGRT